MKLLMYGVSKDTVMKEDVDKYLLDEADKKRQMNDIAKFKGVSEILVLSDDFRNEYYLYVDEDIFSHGEFLRYIASKTEKTLQEVILETYSKFNEDVLRHLFEFTAGYLSEPSGSFEELWTTQRTLAFADMVHTSGPVIFKMFNQAIYVGYALKLIDEIKPLNQSQISQYIYLLKDEMQNLSKKHYLISGNDFQVYFLTKLLLFAGAQTITMIQQDEEESVRQFQRLEELFHESELSRIFPMTEKSLYFRLSKTDAAILDSTRLDIFKKRIREEVSVIRQTKKIQYVVDTAEGEQVGLGGEGKCVTFYSHDDILKLEKFMKDKPVAEQEIGKQMLAETASFAETSSCRRKFLLHYFGEEFEESRCNGMCDNCRHPKQKFEAQDDLEMVLECIHEIKEKHKIKDVINCLMGTLTATAKTYKHDGCQAWGKGVDHDKDDKFWMAVLRQAIVNGFISKDIENYGLLKITEKGRAFLKKPTSIKFTRDHDFLNNDKDAGDDDIITGGKGGSAADEILFALLKEQVKKTAKQKALPPYVIFQEPSLEEMSIQYPITMEEMTKISGVGAGKAAKYGKPFIDLIKKYVEDNEIDRPVDMVIKSVVNKSGLKVYIIQNIDRKINLKDMARSKNLTLPNLLKEIETIVESGTKVNINYYIDDLMDEEKQDEIMEYFKESETDSVEAALKELGENDYSEEEIRVMRIKFLSDYGN